MNMETFGTGQGYLKAGLFGFPKSGKTWSAMLLALEVRKLFNIPGPIAMYDSEGGGEYIAPHVERATGLKMIGTRSRAFVDLVQLATECKKGTSSILIVDSVTHPWRELCLAYLEQVNKAREQMNLSKRSRLEFQDWNAIKERWNVWTTIFLNAPLHIIICGRAGFEWDFVEREGTTGEVHKELVKTGTKMKTEGEFGFEPSLLVEMERVQVPENGKFHIVHRATVLGDRFDAMDGATCDNPTGEWFLPHLRMLTPGGANVVDTELKTDMGVNESGEAQFQRERRNRTKLLEEIQGEIVKLYPGQTAAEKRAKVVILEQCFGTKSWTRIEGMSADDLRVGLGLVADWAQKRTSEEVQA